MICVGPRRTRSYVICVSGSDSTGVNSTVSSPEGCHTRGLASTTESCQRRTLSAVVFHARRANCWRRRSSPCSRFGCWDVPVPGRLTEPESHPRCCPSYRQHRDSQPRRRDRQAPRPVVDGVLTVAASGAEDTAERRGQLSAMRLQSNAAIVLFAGRSPFESRRDRLGPIASPARTFAPGRTLSVGVPPWMPQSLNIPQSSWPP